MNYNSSFGNNPDLMYYSHDESLHRESRGSTNGGNLFKSLVRKFTNGIANNAYDRLNRTSTCCVSASIPTREINHWVRNHISSL